MAILTTEQRDTVETVRAALFTVRVTLNQASALLDQLEAADSIPLLNGQLNGDATLWSDAVAQWAELKAAVIAAANALP
jgi:hypothetical protein